MTDAQQFETSPPSDPQTPDAVRAQSVWPTVIGIILIIFGALGMAGGCLGVLGQALTGVMSNTMANTPAPGMEPTVAQFEVMAQYRTPLIAISAVTLVVASMLLSGGIGVIRRRRWGPTVTIVWAVCKMLVSLPGAWINTRMSKEMFAAMEEASASGAVPAMSGFYDWMQGLGIAGAIFGILWAWALPIFVLIWFSRGKVRAEVKTWT